MTVRDAISHAIHGNPTSMKDSLSSALDTKVADALELKKISVASSYFNEPQTQEIETDEDISTD